MGKKTGFSHRNPGCLVNKYIGTSYDIVKEVHDSLGDIEAVAKISEEDLNAIQVHDKEIKDLKKEVTKVSDTVAEQEERLAAIEAESGYDDSELRERVENVETLNVEQDTRLEALENKPDVPAYDDTKVKEDIASNESRIETLENTTPPAYDDTGIKTDISQNQTDIAEAEARIDSLENAPDTPAYDDTAINARVDDVIVEVDDIEARVTTLENEPDYTYDDSQVKTDINSNTDAIVDVENRVDALETAIPPAYDDTQVKADIADNTSKIEALEDTPLYDDSVVKQDIETNKTDIDNLESSVTSISQEVTGNTQEIASLDNSLTALAQFTADTRQATISNENTITALESKHDTEVISLSDRIKAIEEYPFEEGYDDTALAAKVAQNTADIESVVNDVQALKDEEHYDDTALSGRVTALEEAPAPTPYDDTAISNRIDAIESITCNPYDDTDIVNRLDSLEAIEPIVIRDAYVVEHDTAMASFLGYDLYIEQQQHIQRLNALEYSMEEIIQDGVGGGSGGSELVKGTVVMFPEGSSPIGFKSLKNGHTVKREDFPEIFAEGEDLVENVTEIATGPKSTFGSPYVGRVGKYIIGKKIDNTLELFDSVTGTVNALALYMDEDLEIITVYNNYVIYGGTTTTGDSVLGTFKFDKSLIESPEEFAASFESIGMFLLYIAKDAAKHGFVIGDTLMIVNEHITKGYTSISLDSLCSQDYENIISFNANFEMPVSAFEVEISTLIMKSTNPYYDMLVDDSFNVYYRPRSSRFGYCFNARGDAGRSYSVPIDNGANFDSALTYICYSNDGNSYMLNYDKRNYFTFIIDVFGNVIEDSSPLARYMYFSNNVDKNFGIGRESKSTTTNNGTYEAIIGDTLYDFPDFISNSAEFGLVSASDVVFKRSAPLKNIDCAIKQRENIEDRENQLCYASGNNTFRVLSFSGYNKNYYDIPAQEARNGLENFIYIGDENA